MLQIKVELNIFKMKKKGGGGIHIIFSKTATNDYFYILLVPVLFLYIFSNIFLLQMLSKYMLRISVLRGGVY